MFTHYPFTHPVHCLYFIYVGKIYVCSHLKNYVTVEIHLYTYQMRKFNAKPFFLHKGQGVEATSPSPALESTRWTTF